MPFIHIKSLPLAKNIDVPAIIVEVNKTLANRFNIPLVHITCTWDYFKGDHYAKGEKLSDLQVQDQFPVLVDLFTPDFYSIEQCQQMMDCVATLLSSRAHILKTNIFIYNRRAKSGQVFDDGEIVSWV